MVKGCCVAKCTSESYSGCNVSFHCFPKKEKIKLKWLDVIPTTHKVTKYSVLCGKHFQKEDFYWANKRRMLRPDAVPSIFPVEIKRSHKFILNTQQITSEMVVQEQLFEPTLMDMEVDTKDIPGFVIASPQMSIYHVVYKKYWQVQKLKQRCCQQRKKIKTLSQRCKRQAKKVAELTNNIEELKHRIFMSKETAPLVGDSGPICVRTETRQSPPLVKRYAVASEHNYAPQAPEEAKIEFDEIQTEFIDIPCDDSDDLKRDDDKAITNNTRNSDIDENETAVEKEMLKDKEHDENPELEPPRNKEPDSISLDLVLSVDRNRQNNQLVITLDPTAVTQNDGESIPEHNYALKVPDQDNVEIKSEKIDSDDAEANIGENETDPLDTSRDEEMEHDEEIQNPHHLFNASSDNEGINPSKSYLPSFKDNENYKQKYIIETYKNNKLIEISGKQRLQIDKLQTTCKLLRQKLKRSIHRQTKLMELKKALTNYTNYKEIDNILQGRFIELCSKFGKNKPKTYSDDAMKFAITLFYLSPNCYNLVKKYIELPDIDIIKKYLENRTFVINLNEFDLDDEEI